MGTKLKSLSACVILQAGLTVASPVVAQVWERVCSEGEVCKVLGTRPLRFGTSNKYTYGVATGAVTCTADIFGDPAPGTPKRCEAYYTAQEKAVLTAIKEKDDRIQELEQEVESTRAELDAVNEEAEQLYRELRRDRRREQRRGVRVEQFRPGLARPPLTNSGRRTRPAETPFDSQ